MPWRLRTLTWRCRHQGRFRRIRSRSGQIQLSNSHRGPRTITIASCGQDNKVFIWTQNEPGGEWNKTLLNDFGAPVWRLSWSVMGNVLAVSDANNMVTVWKESVDGRWNQISATE